MKANVTGTCDSILENKIEKKMNQCQNHDN